DAGVRPEDLQEGMRAHAEAGSDAHVRAAHRLPHQERACGAAALVIVVDHPIRGAEAVESMGLPARGDSGRKQLAEPAAAGFLLLLAAEEKLERIASAHVLAEVG